MLENRTVRNIPQETFPGNGLSGERTETSAQRKSNTTIRKFDDSEQIKDLERVLSEGLREEGKCKIPYIPSGRKRFEISDDPYSRGRVKAMKRIYDELSQSLTFSPEQRISVGFSLFGSLSKGKELDDVTAESADLDMAVYIDREELMNNLPALLAAQPSFAKHFKGHPLKRTFIKLVGMSKGRSSQEMEKQINDDNAWESVKKFVEEFIGKKVDEEKSLHLKDKHLFICPISMSGKGSIMDIMEKKIAETGLKYCSQEVANFFHLDIGGGLKKYRQEFLRQLGEQGEEAAEDKWRKISRTITAFERPKGKSEKLDHAYPATYREACKYYLNTHTPKNH